MSPDGVRCGSDPSHNVHQCWKKGEEGRRKGGREEERREGGGKEGGNEEDVIT